MARYDIYPNPDGGGFLLDVQADTLSRLESRIVAPFIPVGRAQPAKVLNPEFEIEGSKHMLLTQQLAAFPARQLKTAVDAIAVERRSEITAALELLLTGY